VTTQYAEEARYLHAALFKCSLSDEVIERYTAAHNTLFPEPDGEPMLRKIVALRLDAEAIEFVLRRRSPQNPLTRKMQILCYLVEVRATYFPSFVNTSESTFHAISELLVSGALSGWKLIKGKYLVWRHGLWRYGLV
jgi:hypothetical protein